MDTIITNGKMNRIKSKYRIIFLVLTIINNYFIVAFGQSNKEFERVINLSDARPDIGFYIYRHKDYETQIDLIKQYIGSENPVVRQNCYVWLAYTGYYVKNYRTYVVETLLDGMNDDHESVVYNCYSIMKQFFNKNDFSENALQKVKKLYYRQLEMFYVLNTYVNSENKKEKDSCWRIYINNPIHYDVIKLIGYLEIKELLPDFYRVLRDFKGRWGFNYADYPLMENPIENYAESRIINPWNIHLALAHMGDTSEINYCIRQFDLVVERNKNKPEIIFDPFMKDMVYIMQPQIISVFKKTLLLAEIDKYYVDFTYRCFRNLIKDFPMIGGEKDVAKEILDWLNANQNNIELNRLNVFKWVDY